MTEATLIRLMEEEGEEETEVSAPSIRATETRTEIDVPEDVTLEILVTPRLVTELPEKLPIVWLDSGPEVEEVTGLAPGYEPHRLSPGPKFPARPITFSESPAEAESDRSYARLIVPSLIPPPPPAAARKAAKVEVQTMTFVKPQAQSARVRKKAGDYSIWGNVGVHERRPVSELKETRWFQRIFRAR